MCQHGGDNLAYRAAGNGTHGATEMPYNSETETFYQAPATVVDSTPDGDTVQEGFDDRLTPAMTGLYADLNLLKADGMISVGIPATTTARGIGRVATSDDLADGATINNGPAFLAAGSEAERLLLRVTEKYDLGEFYYFRHPTLKPGFAPCQGGVLADTVTHYPEIWAYLQTTEGQLLLKTEAEWQAMSTATWATLADGTKVGWNGIGGVPYYVQDLATGTLRLPDLRGMYAEAAGFNSLGVGGTHIDMIRPATGKVTAVYGAAGESVMGVFYRQDNSAVHTASGYGVGYSDLYFDISRKTPTGNANKPRAWGALACCYLGQPA